MKTLNGLPIYRMSVDPFDQITHVEYISLVDEPAIQTNWVAFSKTPIKLSANKDRQILTGPAMIPDMAIFRSDDQLGQYYVTFTREDIEVIATKFNKEQRTLGINYMHQENSQVEGVIIEQWFIADKANDKSNSFGFDLPVGTWMVSVKIEDETFWQDEIKTGQVRGFSIEGFLKQIQLSQIKIKEKMSEIKLSEIKTTDGIVLSTAAEFVVGAEVFITNQDGDQISAPDGDYALENGSVLSVTAGKITAVGEAQAQSEATPEAPAEAQHAALSPEDIKAIGDALGIADLIKRIEALEAFAKDDKAEDATEAEQLRSELKEIKTTLSKIPGSNVSLTAANDAPVIKGGKMTFSEKLNAINALKK